MRRVRENPPKKWTRDDTFFARLVHVQVEAEDNDNHNETQVRDGNSGLRDANGEKAVNPSVRR
jgi:hypothetical protein